MQMKKILFLGLGSKKDPGFEGIKLDYIHPPDFGLLVNDTYSKFMNDRGITVVERFVESCHGCYDIMDSYSKQMQSLVEEGNRVVAILEGGLLFALPSLQSSQTTFPIISYPLDLVSYQSFIVPSGHAAVATVGVDRKGHSQRIKALKLAEKILNLEVEEANIIRDDSNMLKEKLREMGIKADYHGLGLDRQLSLEYSHYPHGRGYSISPITKPTGFLIRADSNENLNDWVYLRKTHHRHHLKMYSTECYDHVPFEEAQVRGLENLAVFATKIISLQKPELREKLKEIAKKKHESYEERNLIEEVNRLQNQNL